MTSHQRSRSSSGRFRTIKTPQSSANTSEDFFFWPTRVPGKSSAYVRPTSQFEDRHHLHQTSQILSGNILTEKMNGYPVMDTEPIYYEPLSPTSPTQKFGVFDSSHIYDHLVTKKAEIDSIKSKQGSLTSSDDGSSDQQNSG